jgi:hypothetical protein
VPISELDLRLSAEQANDVADAVGSLGMSFFSPMPTQKQYGNSFKRGKSACANGGYLSLPYINNPGPLDCAYMDGWLAALNEHHGTAFLFYHEAQAFTGERPKD